MDWMWEELREKRRNHGCFLSFWLDGGGGIMVPIYDMGNTRGKHWGTKKSKNLIWDIKH